MKSNLRIIIVPLVAILALSGCAPKPWYRNNTTAEQFATDNKQCEFEGEKAAAPLWSGNEFAWAGAKIRVANSCLQSKGYWR